METALDKLKRLTAWKSLPELSEADLNASLASAALMDAAGRAPADTLWSPTYDINMAAIDAWMTKAARASELAEADPVTGAVTANVFDNCLRMAALFKAKRNVSVRIR